MKAIALVLMVFFSNTESKTEYHPINWEYNQEVTCKFGKVDLRYERYTDGEKMIYLGCDRSHLLYIDGKISGYKGK